MTVEIIDPAKADLADGFEFDEGQRRGLGNYFLDSLFAAIDSLKIQEQLLDVRWQTVRGIVDKDPGIEVHPPMVLGSFKILREFGDRLRLGHLIRCVDPEKPTLRFQKPVILPITPIPYGRLAM